MSAPSLNRSREPAACLAIFLVVLLASLWFARAGWNNALLDTHPFRQTQTAMSVEYMLRDGFRLDYVTPIMGPPWSIPLEFPIYQAAVAGLCRVTGLPVDQAGRAVSLAFFYAALPALWLILRRLQVPPAQRWLFLALVLTCPVYQFFSRAFLIESTAFCLALWFLNFFHAGLGSGHGPALAAAALLGCAAGLAKVTTYAVYLAPAAALTLVALWSRRAEWRTLLIRAAVAAGPGVLAATWWVHYSDAVKRHNVLGTMLVSSELHDWTYGPLAQRLDPGFWRQFGVQLERALFPSTSLIVLAVLLLLFLRGNGRRFAAILLIAMAGPLAFTNLYFVHDYYLYSSGLFFLLLLALPLRSLMEDPQVPPLGRYGVVGLVLLTQFSGYLQKYYEPQARAAGGPPELALAIARVTQPDDVLAGFGLNWNPVLAYYSHRRAMLVPDRYVHDDTVIREAIRRVRPERIAAVLLYRGQPDGASHLHWLKELGMAETPFFQTGEYSVHLRQDMLAGALDALRGLPLEGIQLYSEPVPRAGPLPGATYWLGQLQDHGMFPGFSPLPDKVTLPFGIYPTAEKVDGHVGFFAHAPTEIELTPPPGARHVAIEFGMKPDGYNGSDGVEFEIVAVQPDGTRQRLFYRWLRPGTVAADRGFQAWSLDRTTPIQGKLLFRTLPGPANNSACDWAYWSRVQVR